MNETGIYKITNKINSKIYIGQSVDLHKRKLSHFNKLKNNSHHNRYLQKSYNKYGEDNFEFEILCVCDENELDNKEIEYINLYETTKETKGYNLMHGGQGGRKFTDGVIQRFRENRLGKKLPPEHCKNISRGKKGFKLSQTSIEKGIKTKKEKKIGVGENNSNSKLANKQVEKIIKELLKNKPVKEIAEKYTVSIGTIYQIMYNVSYIEIMPNVREELKNRTQNIQSYKIEKAIEMYIQGKSQNIIAKELGISRNTLRKELKERNINTKIHKNQYLKQVNTEVNL